MIARVVSLAVTSLLKTVTLFVLCVGHADASPELERLRDLYDKRVEGVDQPLREALVTKLEELESQLASIRQLEAALSVREERLKLVLEGAAAEVPAEIEGVASYNRLAEIYHRQRELKLAPLTRTYLESLSRLEKKAVEEGRLEDALDITAEIERIKGPPDEGALGDTEDRIPLRTWLTDTRWRHKVSGTRGYANLLFLNGRKAVLDREGVITQFTWSVSGNDTVELTKPGWSEPLVLTFDRAAREYSGAKEDDPARRTGKLAE